MVDRARDLPISSATLNFIENRHGHLLLHAGAAAAADGRTIVVHGASGAGKTTLTAALVSTGLAYITDETVCLDPNTLNIEPFRKPLTVKPGSHQLLQRYRPSSEHIDPKSGNWQIPPSDLGGPDLPKAVPTPTVIVFPDVDADQQDVTMTPVSRARAAFLLGEQSSALWRIEPRPLAALEHLVTAAPAFVVTYSDAFRAAAMIRRELLPDV